MAIKSSAKGKKIEREMMEGLEECWNSNKRVNSKWFPQKYSITKSARVMTCLYIHLSEIQKIYCVLNAFMSRIYKAVKSKYSLR